MSAHTISAALDRKIERLNYRQEKLHELLTAERDIEKSLEKLVQKAWNATEFSNGKFDTTAWEQARKRMEAQYAHTDAALGRYQDASAEYMAALNEAIAAEDAA